RPIFLIGLPRSGTTILQDTLCAHPDVAFITNSMHQYVRCFCAAEDLRKRLRLDFRGERYLKDGVEVRPGTANEGHAFLAQWRRVDPYSLAYVEFRIEDFSPEDLATLRENIRKMIWCFGAGARRFLNKSSNHLVHLALVRTLFPDARIIHLV